MIDTLKNKLEIYTSGLCYCSVCAPEDMTVEEIEKSVNAQSPTGIESKWKISPDKFFKDDTVINGGIVECHNGTTRHWLLSC